MRVLCLLLFAVGCSSSSTPAVEQQADQIVVVKSTHTMTLYAKGSVLRTYRVSLGRGPGHAKQQEGDHETPEGSYSIDAKNAHSRFHRALHVSYPNANDKRRAEQLHVSPGGAIMIHGIENGLGWLGSLQRHVDWTDGCIALTDPEIDEVWKLVPVGTPVEIKH
jgi:murein L,D-transpeptidase YafK